MDDEVEYRLRLLEHRVDVLRGKPYTKQTCDTCVHVYRGGDEEGWCSIHQAFDDDTWPLTTQACKRWQGSN